MGLILVICVAFPSVRIHSRIGSSPKDATDSWEQSEKFYKNIHRKSIHRADTTSRKYKQGVG